MKINFTAIGIALLVANSSFAQKKTTGTVSGHLTDEKQEAFPFVNVLLLKAFDSTLSQGAQSDLNGNYTFEEVEKGRYLIMASMVGYEKKYSIPFHVGNQPVQAPVLQLAPEVQALKEVTVVAKKPFIEQQIDRTVINVENSIGSAGATALEVLERAPGVTVDQQNERLRLRGKEGVIVQIDGKQTFLSQSELMNLLKNTPSDNIEKIELITNPSAKYDAVGNSGIINIKFKKNTNFGTNGNLSAGAALTTGNHLRGNGALSLNHRKGKINTYMNGSSFSGEGFSNNMIYRKIPYEGKVTVFDQKSDRVWRSSNYNLRAGLDFFASPKTTWGVLVTGFHNNWKTPNGLVNTTIFDNNLAVEQSYQTHSANHNRMNNVTANLNFKHQFDDKGKELTVDADYATYSGKSGNTLNTTYFDPEGTPKGSPEDVRNRMPSQINIGVAKVDYTQPLWKGKLETGLKSSVVASDNNMVFERKEGEWLIDNGRSNQFKYTENINAAYLNYNGKISSKTSYQLGVRAEHTHSIGNSVTLSQIRDRNYINLFPSVFISQHLDSSNVLNLSYSRRIDRPDYQSLNPFEFYLDPYTFQRGNPNLRPQYTNSFQLTHVYKSFVSTTLSYSRISDVISNELPRQIPSENITYVTADNLDHQDNASLTLSAPIPVRKWWNAQTTISAVYNRYNSYYMDAVFDVKQFSWNTYITNQFSLAQGWSLELSGWYSSKNIYGFYVSRPQGMINAGLQKTFHDKKATLRLNVNDLFEMNKFHGRAQFQDIDFDVRARWPSRQVRISFSYRFGNQNIKSSRQRKTGVNDLQDRIKSGD